MNYAMLLARGRRAPKSAGATITFTQQPADQSAIDGTATFSALAVVSDESLPTYQWQKQEGGAGLWSNVSGATSSSLSLSGLTVAADNGDKYRVVASSPSAISAASLSATMTVTAPAITITQQPANQTAVNGNATLSASATSSPAATLAYQWQRSEFTPAAESPWSLVSGVSGTYFSRIAYGEGLFVCLSGYGQSITSPDGVSWTQRTIPIGAFLSDIIYAAGKFVVVSGSSVATSADGTSWTTGSLPPARGATRLAYGNGVFLAMPNGSNAFSRSEDGVSWSPDSNDNGFRGGIAFGNGLFAAVGSTGNTVRTSSGASLEQWVNRPLPGGDNWDSITFGGGLFVVVDRGPYLGEYQGSNKFATSEDGVTWTLRTVPVVADWVNVSYGGGVFVAISVSPIARVVTSRDGINWTERGAGLPSRTSSYNAGLAYGDGRFVASNGNRLSRSLSVNSQFANVSGANSSSLALAGLGLDDNGDQYRVVVSAINATPVTSSAATLTVN